MGFGAFRWVALGSALLLLGACGGTQGGVMPGSTPTPSTSPSPLWSPPHIQVSPAPVVPSPSRTVEARTWIVISLRAQHLWVYRGGKVLVQTDVTTGMPELPTPPGNYKVMAMYSPYRFISPWPPGSPYYYEPLDVNYAILFAAGGYFIHDAWWQHNFGPGGNLKTGSHGCVNVPPPIMPAIYKLAKIGMEVIVTSS